MKNKTFFKILSASFLSLALIMFLSGCSNDKAKDQNKNSKTDNAKSEELKKPVSQGDIDKELKAIDDDLKSISSDDLKDVDLNENSL